MHVVTHQSASLLHLSSFGPQAEKHRIVRTKLTHLHPQTRSSWSPASWTLDLSSVMFNEVLIVIRSDLRGLQAVGNANERADWFKPHLLLTAKPAQKINFIDF